MKYYFGVNYLLKPQQIVFALFAENPTAIPIILAECYVQRRAMCNKIVVVENTHNMLYISTKSMTLKRMLILTLFSRESMRFDIWLVKQMEQKCLALVRFFGVCRMAISHKSWQWFQYQFHGHWI